MTTVKISPAVPEQVTLAAEIAQLRELDVSIHTGGMPTQGHTSICRFAARVPLRFRSAASR